MATSQTTFTIRPKHNRSAEGTTDATPSRVKRLPMVCYRRIAGGNMRLKPKPRWRLRDEPEGMLTSFEVTWENDTRVAENHFEGYGLTVQWGVTEGSLLLAQVGDEGHIRLVLDRGGRTHFSDAVTGERVKGVIPVGRVVHEEEWLTEDQLDG